MSRISREDLKPFQIRAAGALAGMVQEYPGPQFRARYDPDTGELMPFLCRLWAITGAGKTPILATTADHLANGIVLWTTNRGAVISQTLQNLRQHGSSGKYADLLPEDTRVFLLSEMSAADWQEAMEATDGLTIMLATVASFNQEGDELRIHRKYGDHTRWEMLGGQVKGARQRRLYVFYDEGHGATERQFQRLRELNPVAFVLASASPLPDDLADLLSGRTPEEREHSLEERTVVVPTKDVVEAGLLKNRLFFVDCNTTQADAVREANDKWQALAQKLAPHGEIPISCFIVNQTTRGVDVWEQLVALGVNPSQIAVHLNGARDVVLDRHGASLGLVDTYTGRRTEERSPEMLRALGFTHIIWNMTLREGWDEPLAYVAYIDDRGRSTVDMVQKIGRFVRQPGAQPFADPDLNSAYFYFNVSDEDFTALIRQTQEEMETSGYEVISFSSTSSPPASRTVEPRVEMTIPSIAPNFGDSIDALDQILLNHVTLFADAALTAPGSIRTRVFNVATGKEDEERRSEMARASNDVTTPWQYLSTKLSEIDSRIVDQHGTRFSATLKDQDRMRQPIQVGSEAMRFLVTQVDSIRDDLNAKLELVDLGKWGAHQVKPFKLIAPDVTGVSESQREKYRVRRFQHSIHPEYNGMNPFEVRVAEALDTLGLPWCRNPVGKDGYRIPIPELGADTIWFYPDFLLWTKNGVWAIDPKGNHLKEAAVQHKLLDLSGVRGIRTEIRVALVLEGNYVITADRSFDRQPGRQGYTLIRRKTTGAKADSFPSLQTLVQTLAQ